MAARMYGNSIVALAICLAAILGCAGAVAQDVKLYLKDGSSVDLYKDKKASPSSSRLISRSQRSNIPSMMRTG